MTADGVAIRGLTSGEWQRWLPRRKTNWRKRQRRNGRVGTKKDTFHGGQSIKMSW